MIFFSVLAGPAVSVVHGVPAAGLVGYGGHAHVGYGKRDADAEPEADADADAQFYGAVASIAIAAPVATSPQVCNSVPVCLGGSPKLSARLSLMSPPSRTARK
jgi:hypothetical protein